MVDLHYSHSDDEIPGNYVPSSTEQSHTFDTNPSNVSDSPNSGEATTSGRENVGDMDSNDQTNADQTHCEYYLHLNNKHQVKK